MVVAVSGGPDSVALLLALTGARAHPTGKGLTVAHLNHQLRGDESDADEQFVGQFVEKLESRGLTDIRFQSARVDVAAAAKRTRKNLESTARHLRYAWLVGVCRQVGASIMATGHTADDQAETVFHRLIRGAGFKGLSGIAAQRTLSQGIDVVRPLLSVTRSEILAYLASQNQESRADSSNADLRYMRNRIRHELLPLLRASYNPAIAKALCNLARVAREHELELAGRARQLLVDAELPRAGDRVVLQKEALRSVPRSLVKAALRCLWAREGWARGAMTTSAWQRLAAVACGDLSAVDLPAGIRAVARENVVLIGQAP
jgi:tRNA(Ile)-lysidine synthase